MRSFARFLDCATVPVGEDDPTAIGDCTLISSTFVTLVRTMAVPAT